jgi:hypothetical protein
VTTLGALNELEPAVVVAAACVLAEDTDLAVEPEVPGVLGVVALPVPFDVEPQAVSVNAASTIGTYGPKRTMTRIPMLGGPVAGNPPAS